MCVNIVRFQDAPGSNTASRWGEGNLTSLWFLLYYTDRCSDVTSFLLDLECTVAQGGPLLVTNTKHQSAGIPQLAGRTGLSEFPICSVNFCHNGRNYLHMRGSFKISPKSLYFWEILNGTIISSIFLQNSSLVQLYTCSSRCKCFGNFPEIILWKPLQFFRHVFNNVSTITKVPSLQCWFQSREQVKISWSQVKRVWGVLRCCHFVLLRNPWPKPTGALEHCREVETNCWFSIFWVVSFWPYP